VFYAVPIVAAVWWFGRDAGLLLALANAGIWWAANETTHPYETEWGYGWAVVSRLFFFSIAAVGVGALRTKQAADAERIRMLEHQRQLERDILAVSEHERQSIGQDLHDGLCQQLAAIGCAARALADEMRTRALPEAKDAELIEQYIQQAVIEARDLARGISPVRLDPGGLAAALADLAATTSTLTGTRIYFVESTDVEVATPEIAMHLFRIAQEAVANAVRHSGAETVTVSLRNTGPDLELRIEDNGVGMKGGTETNGMGLRTMQYRAQALGTHLELRPRPGGGTSVACRVRVGVGVDARNQ